MSVIAWDGTTLAADRQMTSANNRHLSTTKIFAENGYLMGGVGTSASMIAVMNWIRDGAVPATYPTIKDGQDSTVYTIDKSGTVRGYFNSPHPVIVENEFFAEGSGVEYALTAMYLGCDAAKAVQVASHFDIYCGNGIDTLTLDGV